MRQSNLSNLMCCLLLAVFSCTKETPEIPVDPPTEPPSSLPERIITDSSYGGAIHQKMDIYLPAGRNKNTRLIVLLHGGAWIGGDKKDLNNYVALFRSKWPEAAVLNINYRFANGSSVTGDTILSDIEKAIKLVTDNREQFSVSDTLFLFGNSAGGHLALLYGYTKNTGKIRAVADLYGPTKLNDWQWYNATWPPIKDWLTKLTGQTWNEELYKRYSPIEHVSSASAPTIIFHSRGDIVVPFYQAEWLKAKLIEKQVSLEFIDWYISFHVFNETDDVDCVTRSVVFFKAHTR